MRKLLPALFMLVTSVAFGQVSLTTSGSPYTQDFNTLASTGTSAALPAGWLMAESGTSGNNNGLYTANDGASNAGDTYSYGTTGSTDRALGGLLSGTLTPLFGAFFQNNTGAPISSITITYVGEQWRLGATGRKDSLLFQYSTDASSLTTGTWVNSKDLDFAGPISTGTVGALNGNATANRSTITYTINGLSIAPGANLYIRWNDFNASGADDGLAVDSFSLTPGTVVVNPCTAPTAQPTALTFPAVNTNTINGSFTAASPAADQYLVVMHTTPAPGGAPANGTVYTEGDAIGTGTVIYKGSGTSFSASSLSSGTAYYFTIFSLNGLGCSGGPLYLTAAPLTGNTSTTTPPVCAAPAALVSNLQLTALSTSVSGTFTAAADADGYLVIRSTNATTGFTPVNGTTYNVGDAAGTGVVVKSGTGTTFATTGLTPSTQYFFFVFGLNGFNCTGGPLYNTTSVNGNTTTTASGGGIPTGYYDTAAGKACADLKNALKWRTLTGHTPKSYGDLWGQYLVSDVKPREVGTGSTLTIWDIYSDNPTGPDPYNFIPGNGAGGQQDAGGAANSEGILYNREHTVPLSWFGGNTSNNGPATDYLHLYPTDKFVNAQRSNFIYGEVAAGTTYLNGGKLGANGFAGLSGTAFEPIDAYKGDVARSFLYFVTRYQDNMPGWDGGTNGGQAFDPTLYPSVDTPYLKLMLKWHNQDPVSQKEIDRNNAAFVYQGNRNPYIDHPEYADQVWNFACIRSLPVDLLWFAGKLQNGNAVLSWQVANEVNLKAYGIERSVNGRDYNAVGNVAAAGKKDYFFTDNLTGLSGRRVYYRLKIQDKDGSFRYSEVFSVHVPSNNIFSIYPNPAKHVLNLQLFDGLSNGSLSITDLTGRVQLTQSISNAGGLIPVNIQQLAAGSYLVKVVTNKGEFTQRFQKL